MSSCYEMRRWTPEGSGLEHTLSGPEAMSSWFLSKQSQAAFDVQTSLWCLSGCCTENKDIVVVGSSFTLSFWKWSVPPIPNFVCVCVSIAVKRRTCSASRHSWPSRHSPSLSCQLCCCREAAHGLLYKFYQYHVGDG